MIPIHQTIFPTEDIPLRGNCFQACLASLLELPLESVPHFMQFSNWTERLDEWLAHMGLAQVEIALGVEADHAYLYPVNRGIWCLLAGLTNRHPTRQHCVVAKTAGGGFSWDYIHDPHPDGSFLTDASSIMFIVPLDPARSVPIDFGRDRSIEVPSPVAA